MTIKEFEKKYPDSPVVDFFKKKPIASILFGLLVFSFITKII